MLATYRKIGVANQKLDELVEGQSATRVPAPATEADAVQGPVQLTLETQEVGDNMADSQFKSELVSLILYATFMDYCQRLLCRTLLSEIQ